MLVGEFFARQRDADTVAHIARDQLRRLHALARKGNFKTDFRIFIGRVHFRVEPNGIIGKIGRDFQRRQIGFADVFEPYALPDARRLHIPATETLALPTLLAAHAGGVVVVVATDG